MKILAKLFSFFKKGRYPEELKINGRKKLPSSSFEENDKLYHSFDSEDLENDGGIKIETIRFPDFSCNWSKFSKAEHVRFRKNGKPTDGCYSFTVLTARYKEIATPVHDPLDDTKYPNYSHVEVRTLPSGENCLFEPPKNRPKPSKAKRVEYRQNLTNNVKIELNPI